MSFNVRGSFRDATKKTAWRNRADLNVATIKSSAPDVIGLQEAQRGNLATYRQHLRRYAQIRGPRCGNAFPYDFNAILYDPEKLRPLATGGFWLSETPQRHSRSWDTRVARSATWALFDLTNSDLPILHLNTHLDHVSAPARQEGTKLIVEKVGELRTGEDPTNILTGDFNARPGNTGVQNPHRRGVRGHLPRRGQQRRRNREYVPRLPGKALPRQAPRPRTTTHRLDTPKRPQRAIMRQLPRHHPRGRRRRRTLSERSLPDRRGF